MLLSNSGQGPGCSTQLMYYHYNSKLMSNLSYILWCSTQQSHHCVHAVTNNFDSNLVDNSSCVRHDHNTRVFVSNHKYCNRMFGHTCFGHNIMPQCHQNSFSIVNEGSSSICLRQGFFRKGVFMCIHPESNYILGINLSLNGICNSNSSRENPRKASFLRTPNNDYSLLNNSKNKHDKL